MGNKDYIKKELEQFLKDIKFWRGIALRIVGGFMFILLGNLAHSYLFPGTILDEMMEAIPPPLGAEKVHSRAFRDGRHRYYFIPIEKDAVIVEYYKKELSSKGWQYRGVDLDGYYEFTKNGRPGFKFTLNKTLGKSLEKKYNWRMTLSRDQ